MTVTAADSTVELMNSQFRALIAADLSGLIDGFALRVVVAASPFATTPLYIPAAPRIVDDMMRLWTFWGLH